jgi:hypothetical protein
MCHSCKTTTALLTAVASALCGCVSVAPRPNPRFEFTHGMSMLRESPTPAERAAGIRWIRRAAHENFALAQDRLGLMYLYGDGVTQNTSRALKWIRAAAERGAPAAQLQLGSLYSAGNCVPRDDARAYYWFAIAAKPVASSVSIDNISDVWAFARTLDRSVAPALTVAERAAIDRRVGRWTPAPSVPYSGTVLLSRWVCVHPRRARAARLT